MIYEIVFLALIFFGCVFLFMAFEYFGLVVTYNSKYYEDFHKIEEILQDSTLSDGERLPLSIWNSEKVEYVGKLPRYIFDDVYYISNKENVFLVKPGSELEEKIEDRIEWCRENEWGIEKKVENMRLDMYKNIFGGRVLN